ncbi:MAG TPA: ABC-F family ATP-binding cassette domain-containing protein [Treponemataceae bacterium]|jgi:ATP-binding cassette subfamily F protein 3|nr:ABC-F family ATP-binding cassette domain-containing protein [Treponemataceae bacterium]
MAFVQFSRVSLAFGDRDILSEVSLNLQAGTKAALAGANGSGKSTLMKVLAGSIQPDSGERAIQRDARVSYLPQSGIVHAGRSLLAEAETAFARAAELERRLEEIGEELAGSPDAAREARLLAEHHEAQVALDESGWHRRRSLAEQVLVGLGFSLADMGRPVEEFSGGWQMRVALAKLLLERPDILLLDEPTNYLDLEARSWLEDWLRDFPGGFLIVSHDRYFLDVTVNEVYELFGGRVKRYQGTYTNYERLRAAELDSLVKRYEEQQEEIAKIEDFIRRFRYNASKAAMVQGRIKQLEKIERIEIPESLKRMRFSFPPAPHSGRLVVTTEGFGKSYGGRSVIAGLDLTVEKGERLVVVGRNGAGKSTLLRALAGVDRDYAGTIALGSGVSLGYFSQDNAETLVGPERILDLLEAEAPTELVPRLRDMLGAFLFRGDDVYKQVSVLSGGEKSRLALLRLLLKPINLLILDEPTNHLDLHSKDVLLDALARFGGTVVFVSHDRAFIESLATRVLELTASEPGSPSRVRSFPGDYRYYLERIAREESGEEAGGAVRRGAAKAAEGKPFADATPRAGSYEEEKRLKAERRKREREEERLLAEIEAAEAGIKELETRLADPAVYANAEKSRATQREIEALGARLDELTAEWERVASA